MSYSFINRKKLLAILLIVTMVLSLFTGCFGTKDPDPSEDDPQSNVPPGLVEVKPTEEPTEATEPEPTLGGKTATVIGDLVNVRNVPGTTNGTTVGHLEKGTVVRIIRTERSFGVDWALTESGWVAAEYLDFNYEPEFTDTSTPDNTDATEPDDNSGVAPDGSIKGVVTAGQLYIRETPKDGEVIGSYKKSDVVTIAEVKDGWGKTAKGWISMEYVSTTGGTDTKTETNNKKEETTNQNDTVQGTAANIKGIINTAELNIRKEPSTNSDRVGGYTYGNRVIITETKDGWGKTDKGWISLNYVYQDGTTGNNTAKGIVTGNGVNIRSGPGTEYDKVGTKSYGDRLNILEQFKYGNTTWACINEGWICLDYVYVDGQAGEGSGAGKVTGDGVNIRSGPGTGYDKVGSVSSDEIVEILAQFTINGTDWGCTKKGWICMDYVDMTGFEG